MNEKAEDRLEDLPGVIAPHIGDVVRDRLGYRAQCIANPGSRRNARGAFMDTRFVFRRSPGVHWCVDQPTGVILPRSEWTGAERVRAVTLVGRDDLFDFVEEEWRRDDLYEQTLIEAVLGVDDLREAFDLWDEPDHLDRWILLAEAFDRVRRPAIEPIDAEAVL